MKENEDEKKSQINSNEIKEDENTNS